jgi:hypothetical protein|tara:strand:- start:3355 stop:3789 length:435 start_codon:yes stop_codon:yes gene_type:complete
MKKYLFITLSIIILFGCTKETYLTEPLITPQVDNLINNEEELSNIELFNNMNRDVEVELTFYGNLGVAGMVIAPTWSDTLITPLYTMVVDTTETYTLGVGESFTIIVQAYNACYVQLDVTLDDNETYSLYDDSNSGSIYHTLQN